MPPRSRPAYNAQPSKASRTNVHRKSKEGNRRNDTLVRWVKYQAMKSTSTANNDLYPQGNIVAQLASYVIDHREKRSDEASRNAAVKCLADLIAVAAGGVNESGPTSVRAMVHALFPGQSAPVWFTGEKSSVLGAAWCNSAAASALDLDDGSRIARGHPGAAVIPTALAVGEEVGAEIEDIITAIVIGYEVGVATGSARTSYGSTGTWAPYAVVATAAALRRTDRDRLEYALAIAGESAPNQAFASSPAPRVPPPEGNTVKEGIPWSVVTGLCALELAEAGYTGPRNRLDSVRLYDFPAPLKLGSYRHITNTYMKIYSCCRHIHAPIDALLQVLDDHAIDVDAITSIEAEVTSGALRITNKVQPLNIVDVQYSIPYCLALVARVGPETLLPLTDDVFGHDGVADLAKRVNLTLSAEFDAEFPAKTLARVTVVCGEDRYVSRVTAPKGEAPHPLSWDDLTTKAARAISQTTTTSQLEEFMAALSAAQSGDAEPVFALVSHQVLTSEIALAQRAAVE